MLDWVTWLPDELTALAVTVSVCATGSVHALCQDVPDLLIVPVTALAPRSRPVTVTEVSLPPVAVTVMPLAGLTALLPDVGEKLSVTPEAGDFPPSVVPPAEPPDWHAAASRPAAQMTANGASLRRRDGLRLCSTLSSRFGPPLIRQEPQL